jgi:hypothetical protein
MKRHLSLALALLTAATAALSIAACSSDPNGGAGSGTGSSSTAGTAATGSGGAGSGSGGGESTSSLGIGGGIFATSTGAGNPMPEVCDGIDNDGDGAIDNVDVGNDGVCDCLSIATLGLPGNAGTGNVFAAWLNERSDNGAVNLNDAVITAELLKPFHVIVTQNLSQIGRTYSQAEVDALAAWINGGGGMITLIGYADTTERTNVNTLLAPFGVSYGPEPILPKNGSSTIPITEWVAHPTTEGVTAVGFDNGYPVNGDAMALATKDGWVVARAKEISTGHVFVWGDEWITFDSEWSGHPEYQIEHFWLNLIKWATKKTECQVDIPPPQ